MLIMNPHPTLSIQLAAELSAERARLLRRGPRARINRP